jgi:hypothetical protein
MWFRFIHQRRSLTLSDFFLLVAAAVVLAVMIIFQKEYELGAMHRSAKARQPSSEVKKVPVIVYISAPCTQTYHLNVVRIHDGVIVPHFNLLDEV